MTAGISQGERLVEIGDALRHGLILPTDTMITDDIPLLLTKLSAVPAVPEASPSVGSEETVSV